MLLEKVTVIAPELWEPRRRYRTKKRDAYLREHRGVDPALLAGELGVTEQFVRMYERKLGTRRCKQNPRKGDVCCDL